MDLCSSVQATQMKAENKCAEYFCFVVRHLGIPPQILLCAKLISIDSIQTVMLILTKPFEFVDHLVGGLAYKFAPVMGTVLEGFPALKG